MCVCVCDVTVIKELCVLFRGSTIMLGSRKRRCLMKACRDPPHSTNGGPHVDPRRYTMHNLIAYTACVCTCNRMSFCIFIFHENYHVLCKGAQHKTQQPPAPAPDYHRPRCSAPATPLPVFPSPINQKIAANRWPPSGHPCCLPVCTQELGRATGGIGPPR